MKSNSQTEVITCRVFIIEKEIVPCEDDDTGDVFSRIKAYQNAINKSVDDYREDFIRFVNFVVGIGGTISIQSKNVYISDPLYNIYKNPITIKISKDKIKLIKDYSLVYKVEVS